MGEQAKGDGSASREAVIMTLAVSLLAILHYRARLPWLGARHEIYGWFALTVVLLFAVPLFVVRFVLRERPSAFGLSIGRPRVWARDLAVGALVLVPLAALAARIPGLAPHYLRYRDVALDPWSFIPLALGWGAYFFAWEFFFRGFLMMGLSRRFGRSAIFIQLIPFVMAHFGKHELEVYASIPGGLCLAWIAWRGQTFVGAWLLHWLVATSMNLCFVFWPAVRP